MLLLLMFSSALCILTHILYATQSFILILVQFFRGIVCA